MILYEYPFNERVRTLLRLEDLFDKLAFFVEQTHAYQHHSALVTLFEILDVASRADLKSDLLQELERQRQILMAFRNNPDISEAALNEVLDNIHSAQNSLQSMQGKTGQLLRESEWLMSIRSRTIIPGGACEFDLPSYHAWQHKPSEQRQQDILTWASQLIPLRDGLRIVLRLLRESGHRLATVAPQGTFQQMLGGRQYQMMQVRVDEALQAIPEISANKYMLWVRFTIQGGDMKPKPVESDIPFELSLCNL